MNSENLTRIGFCNWQPFRPPAGREILRGVPTLPGVFAIRRETSFPCARGTSDLIYIGSATNENGLRTRIGQIFTPGPTQSTNRRLRDLVGKTEAYNVSWLETDSKARAKQLKSELLEQYEKEHGELPPENLRR
ncbi:MAG TPA: hypothetical protein VMX16_07930 [Terriglobia bacterium]|nr:hypothetical protein [Terriglobia bacterium]